MNAGQRGARRLITNTSGLPRDTICASCLHRLSQQSRRYAAAAAAAVEEESHQEYHIPPVTQTAPQKAYRLLASPVLSRPPVLTRELTPFEKAFYLYQKRLNERLALPFSRYFYIKDGTPADEEWKRKRALRKTASRDIGVYTGYGDEAWNDEVLVGDPTAEPSHQVEALIRDAEGKDIADAKSAGEAREGEETTAEQTTGDEVQEDGMRKIMSQQVKVERPMPRVTEADKQNDTKSLNRKLDRSLYLLVKRKDNKWRFPEDRVYGRENLHQAAERTLMQALGINMNTWFVGNHPIGYHAKTFALPEATTILPNALVSTSTESFEQEELGEKVFFMKGRILAGQADISKNAYGDLDFQWLAKEEVEERVEGSYWKSVRNMLTER